jgi:hypothetical protein
MGTRSSLLIDSKRGLGSTGPARSGCGGQAPTSLRGAHSRTAADPSDPSLEPLAAREVTESKHRESLTQTKAEKFQLNCVPRQHV